MRFEQFENDALISYGKKHGYITEGMSEEEINEFLPAVAAAARAGAKGLGMAAKGAGRLAAKGGQKIAKSAKAAGKAVGDKAVGAVADKAQGMGATGADVQQLRKDTADQGGVAGKIANTKLAKNITNKVADKMAPAPEVPPGADMELSPTGQQHKVHAGAKDVGTKHDGHGHKTDPKDQSKIAQRATALKQVVGNKGSGGQVAAGLDKVSAGNTMSPQLIKAIAPYTQKLQVIMNDPQLSTKFRQLMKQADTAQSQQQTHA